MIPTLSDVTRSIWEVVKFIWATGAAIVTIIIVAILFSIIVNEAAKWIKKLPWPWRKK